MLHFFISSLSLCCSLFYCIIFAFSPTFPLACLPLFWSRSPLTPPLHTCSWLPASPILLILPSHSHSLPDCLCIAHATDLSTSCFLDHVWHPFSDLVTVWLLLFFLFLPKRAFYLSPIVPVLSLILNFNELEFIKWTLICNTAMLICNINLYFIWIF